MTSDQLQRRTALFNRNDAALDRWPDTEDPAFKREVESVAHALQDLAREADFANGDRLERSRTWRYAGNAFFDLSSGKWSAALQQAHDAFNKAEALLEGIDELEEQRKLDYALGHTLMGLCRGKELALALQARRRYERSLQTARRTKPEAIASAQSALARAEKLVVTLEEVDRLSQELEGMEEEVQRRKALPPPPGAEDPSMAGLFEQLNRHLEADKQKGTLDRFQQEDLEQLLGEVAALFKSESSQTLHQKLAGDITPTERVNLLGALLNENLTGRTKAGELVDRLRTRIKDSAYEQASGRAARVLSGMQALKEYIVVENMRPGKVSDEAEKGQDLFRRLSRLTTALTEVEPERVRRLEREVARPLAREVRLFGRRTHLTLARPLLIAGEPASDPNLVFFSGRIEVRAAVDRAAQSLGLEVSPAFYPGIAAAEARMHDLAAAALAVFDLSDHDPQGFYELGIALTMGSNLLLLAEAGTQLPFDVAQDVCYYASFSDLSQLLPDALDAGLYSLQTRQSGSSLLESIRYLERVVRAESDSSALHGALEHLSEVTTDPVRVRAALHLVNSHLETPILPLYPRWPGVYPHPEKPRCFVVMPFRRELDSLYVDIAKACTSAGITPVRGDVAEGQDIIVSIWQEIGQATHLIVDLTDLNPNVCLELGIADTLGKRTLLIGSRGRLGLEALLFPSIAKRRCHAYGPKRLSAPVIRRELENFLRTSIEGKEKCPGPMREPQLWAIAKKAPRRSA